VPPSARLFNHVGTRIFLTISALESLGKGTYMYTDHGKRKERRQAILDHVFENYTGWRYQGGIPLSDLCLNVTSCRYSDKTVGEYTLYKWIKSDLKNSYQIIRHHGRYWVHRR